MIQSCTTDFLIFFLPTVTEKRQKSYVKQDMNQLIKFILKIVQVRVKRNLDRTIEVSWDSHLAS